MKSSHTRASSVSYPSVAERDTTPSATPGRGHADDSVTSGQRFPELPASPRHGKVRSRVLLSVFVPASRGYDTVRFNVRYQGR